MSVLIIFESFYGNTELVAHAIARGVGEHMAVEVTSIDSVGSDPLPADLNLLIVGGPTQGHGVEAAMKSFLDRLPAESIAGLPVASFDTRLNWPKLLSGAASKGIADRLTRKGALLVSAPESFLVESKDGPLLAGEEERAEQWGQRLAAFVTSGQRTAVVGP
jgi:flavodoxin